MRHEDGSVDGPAVEDLESRLVELEETNHRLRRHAQDVSTVAHVFCHDLTNLLNSVNLMAAGLSLGGGSRVELAASSRETQELVRRMGGMVRGFIRLIDVVGKPARPAVASFEEAVTEVLDDVLVQADWTEELDFQAAWDCSSCWADPDHLRQVFDQLLSNAIKFRDPAKDRLRIRLGSTADADGVQVMVMDNGLGIPRDQQPWLFSLSGRARRPAADGLGVGLVIVKRLVELNNGSVFLESAEGQGTRITLTLPSADGRGGAGDVE